MKTLAVCLASSACLILATGSGLGTLDARAFSSDQATLIELAFEGELLVLSAPLDVRRTIDDQLLYTIGHLNGDRAVGRLDAARITGVRTTDVIGGTRIQYHVVLPVAWGAKSSLPQSYVLRLPRRADSSGLDAFTKKYADTCVDAGAHDVDAAGMWYYYRPKATGCTLDPADVVTVNATATVVEEGAEARYPEYDRVWNDNAFDAVVIFGKYEEGATTESDAGVNAYNEFIAGVRVELSGATTSPTSVPTNPGVSAPDITFTRTDSGKRTTITALLIDSIAAAGSTFETRYAALSQSADLIVYNGHSALGRAVRALAQKGKFVSGKYLVLFVNSADSFAYIDPTLPQKRAALNPDDPRGTKYLDVLANAMPAYFHSMPSASLALIRGLRSLAAPRTYAQILRNIDAIQVALVTGEEDNDYQPPSAGPPIPDWTGMNEAAAVSHGEERLFETPLLSGGKYTFTMTHDPANPGGDADLYVRVGQRPTTSSYDCRPYKSGSDEECAVGLAAGSATQIFVMVRGYASQTSYVVLTGRR